MSLTQEDRDDIIETCRSVGLTVITDEDLERWVKEIKLDRPFRGLRNRSGPDTLIARSK